MARMSMRRPHRSRSPGGSTGCAGSARNIRCRVRSRATWSCFVRRRAPRTRSRSRSTPRASRTSSARSPATTRCSSPRLAKLSVDVARDEGAHYVAHGSTGKGNDQVRFDLAVGALAPEMTVIAPLRSGMNMTRDDEIDYAKARGIPVPVTKKSPYSVDENLWGRSIEAGVLEDPWGAPPRDVFQWTVDPDEAPEKPYEIIIGFSEGIPVALDGEATGGVRLTERLNALGGKHGVGRI